jgi:hypothetical protein
MLPILIITFCVLFGLSVKFIGNKFFFTGGVIMAISVLYFLGVVLSAM